jgi:hypothetical protein
VVRPTQQRLASPGRTYAAATAGGRGPAEDVIELIMADHRRIRRLREALYDALHFGESDPESVLAHVWQRLASLLEVHARAEEEICFLPMSGSGPGAAGRIRDAVCDHDDIREAISEASLQRVGSAPWWRAVRAALAVSAEHLEREERDVLACCGLTESQRFGLGREWAGFVTALRQDVNPRPSRSSRPPAVRRVNPATASAPDAMAAADRRGPAEGAGRTPG